MGGQTRGDKECPFSGVTSCGRVWRKVPESGARSVPPTHRVPGEIKRREVELDPQVSPEEIKSREVELAGLRKSDFFCFRCYSTASAADIVLVTLLCTAVEVH